MIKFPTNDSLGQYLVCQIPVVSTGLVLLAIVVTAPLIPGIDELGLYNPIHMLLTTGRMTYPVYGQIDGFTIHPPFRYLEIATLMEFGLKYFQAFYPGPILLTILVSILLMLVDWPCFIKAAACIALMLVWQFMFSWISVRPDAEVFMAWLSGLLVLEIARQRSYPPLQTVSGAVLMTYASVLHYFATLAMIGTGVYVIHAWLCFGFKKATRVLGFIAAGAAVLLLPYAILYILPNWSSYDAVFDIGSTSLGATDQIVQHFKLYSELDLSSPFFDIPNWTLSFLRMIDIPLFVIPIVGFFLWPGLWTFAVASLPMLIFVLAQSRKWSAYLFPEYFIIWFGLYLILFWFINKFSYWLPKYARGAVVTCIAGVMVLIAIISQSRESFSEARLASSDASTNEQEVARASSKVAIGNNTTIGGRLGSWYVSGATRWYDISPDVLWNDNTGIDLASYFKQFDYIVEDADMSDSDESFNRGGISTWYGDGLLSLRGFYLGSNSGISYVRLSSTPGPIIGDVYSSGILSEFREEANGSAMLVTAFCQAGRPELDSLKSKFVMDRILLPKGGEVKVDGVGAGQQELVLVFSKGGDELLNLVGELPGCGVKQVVHGSAKDLDLARVLPLAKLDQNVMDFELMRTQLRDKYLADKK